MNLERLAHIAIVKNHLRELSENIQAVSKDKKKQVQVKLSELDKIFLDEILGADVVSEKENLKLEYLSPADKRILNGVEAAATILNDLAKTVISVKDIENIVFDSSTDSKEAYETLKKKTETLIPDMTSEDDAKLLAESLARAKKTVKKKTNKI